MQRMSNSITSFQTIRDRIIALDATIDEQTLADTLEGLTDLYEMIAAVARSALVDEAMVAGLKGHMRDLQDRMQRITDRAASRRRIARDAMLNVDVKKIKAPDFTLSVRPGTAAVTVFDEAAIPEVYWKPRDPVLDRVGLLSDLKAGVAIAGARLSNPEPVLSVRVR
jgi:hypothetical protein